MPGSDLVQPNYFLSGAPISQALCKHDQILSHSCPTSKRAISLISATALIAFFYPWLWSQPHWEVLAAFQSKRLGIWKQSKELLSFEPLWKTTCVCFLLMPFCSEPWHENEVASPLLPSSDNSALFFPWLCACKLIFILPALSFRSIWGPAEICFIIAIYACVLVGKGCVLLFLFLWWFSALVFLLETVGLQQDFFLWMIF